MSPRVRHSTNDYYHVLGVSPGSSTAEIRRAYRERVREWHPDVNPADDAAARFAAIVEAYDTLADPDRRRSYDLGRRPPHATSNGRQPAMPHMDGPHDRPRAAEEAGPPTDPALRGPDICQTVSLTLREAAFGTKKTIEVPRHDVCPRCHGTGAGPGGGVRQCGRCHGLGRGRRSEPCEHCHGSGVIPSTACSTCEGRGRVYAPATFPLRFPPAVEEGEVLRIKNEGEPGPQGGPRGDLRLRVAVAPDPVLSRRGADAYATIEVTADQARRGGRLDVPTLHGSAHLDLPSGASNGTQLTMRGQGLRLKGRWRRGNQYVTVRVLAAPEPVTDDVADA